MGIVPAPSECLEKQYGVGSSGCSCLGVAGLCARIHLLGVEYLQGADKTLGQKSTRQIEIDLCCLGTAIRRDKRLSVGVDRLKYVGDISERRDDGATIERRSAIEPGLGRPLLLLRAHAVEKGLGRASGKSSKTGMAVKRPPAWRWR